MCSSSFSGGIGTGMNDCRLLCGPVSIRVSFVGHYNELVRPTV